VKLIYRCLCMVLGTLLGTGCSDDMNDPVEYGPMPEYGVPTGSIHVTGRVVDNQGTPIEGARVAINFADADTTGVDGSWTIEEDYAFIPCADGSTDCTVEATDIDGPANGGPYQPTEVILDLDQTDPGSGSYDLGTWEQHGVDIVLDETKKDES
jgi:putative lipoprotein (rSAM/lipoprotein system)